MSHFDRESCFGPHMGGRQCATNYSDVSPYFIAELECATP